MKNNKKKQYDALKAQMVHDLKFFGAPHYSSIIKDMVELPVEVKIREINGLKCYKLTDLGDYKGSGFSCHYSWHPNRVNQNGLRNNIVCEFEILSKGTDKKDKVGVIKLSGHNRDIDRPPIDTQFLGLIEIEISEFEADALISQAEFIAMANGMGHKTFAGAALQSLVDLVHLLTQLHTFNQIEKEERTAWRRA